MIWHNAATNPPEPFADVLLAVKGEAFAAEGCRVAGEGDVGYMFSTGHPVQADRVYAWTELPACPVKVEGGLS